MGNVFSDYDRIINYIEENMEFKASYYSDDYLKRRISSRMRKVGVDSYSDYFSVLKRNKEEEVELLDRLSVNKTEFFRNKDMWMNLQELLDSDEFSEINAWSAGCSDGREPYSLVILGLESGFNTRDISVLATDIDENSLEKAKRGSYVGNNLDDIEEQFGFFYKQEYIKDTGDFYKIDEKVKSCVDFEKHDLIQDRVKRGFNLVFCRNLFIYIGKEYKKQAFSSLVKAINSGGYLVLGKTETIPNKYKKKFEDIYGKSRIYKYID